MSWFLRYRKRAGAAIRLYAFAWAGAGAPSFRSWARAIPEPIEFVAVQLPGRGHRLSEPVFEEWDPLIDALEVAVREDLKDVEGRFAFFGHCVGGQIAHALAARLRNDLAPEALFLLATRAPSILPIGPPLHTLPEAQLLAEGRRRFSASANETPESLVGDEEFRGLAAPAFRGDSRLSYEYSAAPDSPLPIPIYAFAGAHDDLVPVEHVEAWRDFTARDFTFTVLDSGHFPSGVEQRNLRRTIETRLLASLPLTANGLDCTRPPAPEMDEYEAPQGETETVLAEIWSEVLKVERIGRHDHFFELGGHSLVAMQTIARVREAFEVEVPLRTLFESPTVKELATSLSQLCGDEQHRAERLPVIAPDASNRYVEFPLTDVQAAYWIGRGGSFVLGNVATYGYREVQGPDIDIERLNVALQCLIRRHEMMRMVVSEQGRQRILEHVPDYVIAVNDLRQLQAEQMEAELLSIRERLSHQVLPADRWPLFSVEASLLPQGSVRLHIGMDLLFCDAWSLRLLFNEWMALYENPQATLPPLELSFRDYVLAEQTLRKSPRYQRAWQYWNKRLESMPPAPALPLLTDPEKIAQPRFGQYSLQLSAEHWNRIKAHAGVAGLTPTAVLLTVYADTLAMFSGERRFTLNLTLFNRLPLHPQVEQIVGDFTSLLPVLADSEGTGSFLDRARRMQRQLWEDLDHRLVSGTQIMRERARRQGGYRGGMLPVVFTSVLGLADQEAQASIPVLGEEGFGVGQTPQVWLDVVVLEMQGQLSANWNYVKELFAQEVLEGAFEVFREELAALEDFASWHQEHLVRLPRNQQVIRGEVNATTQPLCTARLEELFLARAQEQPDNVAIITAGRSLTYRQLERHSAALSQTLRRREQPGAVVAIVMQKGWEQIAAALGILRAGMVYVPIDPAVPTQRLHELLSDSSARVVLTQSWVQEQLPWPSGVECIAVDQQAPAGPGESIAMHEGGCDELAYLIYTSGSTGKPKGVMISHRGAVNTIQAINRMCEVDASDRILAVSSLSFDLSVYDIFGMLAAGAGIVLPEHASHPEPRRWLEAMERSAVTLWNSVPMLFEMVLAEAQSQPQCLRALRVVMLSGDWISTTLPQRTWELSSETRILAMGGATEASIWSIYKWVEGVAGHWSSIPYGRPLANQRWHVLNESLQPCPTWTIGELYIAGEGLALGYWHDEQRTAQSFIEHPQLAERLYRTGDLGRYLPDGEIELIGRRDTQVKILGHRIELGEIEATLLDYAGMKECAVVAVGEARTQRTLAAYLVAKEEGPLDLTNVRQFLTERLPSYMVPRHLQVLQHLPLSSNGKIDRKALSALQAGTPVEYSYVAPRTELERSLAQIWAEILEVERVGIHDNFFELGGHSLRATQAVARIRQRLGVEVPLRELFEHSVLERFAERLDAAQATEWLRIERADRNQPLALSYAQQRLWFLDRLQGASSAYHIFGAVRLRGALDVAALQRSLDTIVARHEVLRTVFSEVGGEPVQRIAPEGFFSLRAVDLRAESDRESEVARHLAEEAQSPFDLGTGPLIRGVLMRLAAEEHLLAMTMHHIVSDGWSIGVLLRELSQLYGAYQQGEPSPLAELPIQYADYAQWQRHGLRGEVVEKHLEYWRERLEGAPTRLELPTDRPRPAVLTHRGGVVPFELGEALSQRLRELSRRYEVTMFMMLAAAFNVLLNRYSGQDDISVGYPVANRNRTEAEGLIGFFVNTLVLRTKLAGEERFEELLTRVRDAVLDADAHQDLPFEKLVGELNPQRSQNHTPLFQVMLALNNVVVDERVELPGLELHALSEPGWQGAAKFELTLSLQESRGSLGGFVEYNADLFDRERIERIVKHYEVVLEGIAANPGAKVKDLPLLTAQEREQVLLGFNATAAAYPREKCIHELFEEQVARSPSAIALEYTEERLTYAELNHKANQLAHYLVKQGVGPDALVAICVERGVEMVVGLLGILKAGGAYVPLDPSYPRERLRYLLEDARPRWVLTQANLQERLPESAATTICLDLERDTIAQEGNLNLDARALGLRSDRLAYVIYTSGSTGEPKGVMLEHAGLCNLVTTQARRLGFDATSRVLQFASLSFDACTWEWAMALLSGASLSLAAAEDLLPGEPLLQTLRTRRISHVTLPPPVLGACSADAALPDLQTLVVAGEACSSTLVQRWASGRRLINAYGPTEITICASTYVCDPNDVVAPPIGRPISNTRIYLLDGSGQPVPVGVVGEIHIAGEGIARGYLHRPELTAERFVRDPFSQQSTARMYKTGDLGRWRADGNIEFLGRNDHQVKIRGFRIELGEIEAQLSRHEKVKEAVVVAREGDTDKRLVAYVTHGEVAPTVDELREHVGRVLPGYMVPGAYVLLPSLPLTANGKLDRKALPAPELQAYGVLSYEAPAGEAEEAVAEIWAQLLQVERVGREDNFFTLGGHSLLIVQMIERLRRVGWRAAVRSAFDSPTLAGFAKTLSRVAEEYQVPANLIPAECMALTPQMLPLIELTPRELRWIEAQVPGGASNIQDIYPLAPLQEGILFHHLLAEGGDTYVLPSLLRVRSQWQFEQLVTALQRVLERHDVLRTAVLWEGLARPVQVVYRRVKLLVEELELCGERSAQEQLQERMRSERSRIDLRSAPLLRVLQAREGENRYVLLYLHHLTLDHVALEELIGEVRAFLSGAEPALLEPVAYREFVARALWQEKQQEAEEFFRRKLGDVSEATLPFGLLDVYGDGREIEERHCAVEEALGKRIRSAARRQGVSAATLFHVVWGLVVGRTSGREDVVFGTVLTGRMQGFAGAERAIGMFINTLPVRMDLGVGDTRAVLKRAQAELAELLPYEQASLSQAQRCSAAGGALFGALLNYRHSVAIEREEQDSGIELLGGYEWTNYPLTLTVDDLGNEFTLKVQADRRIDADRVVGYVRQALEVVVASLDSASETPMTGLSILPEEERRCVLEEFNATVAECPREQLIHELFEEQVVRNPTAIALVYEEARLTYEELNHKANQLARYLRKRGLGPDQLVGLCVEPGLEMVVGLLGILKSGAAYVPLDPSYPESRLRYVLEDAAPRVVLTQAKHEYVLMDFKAKAIALDAGWAQIGEETSEDLDRAVGSSSQQLAYVIYTSGSTGEPKGVAAEHRGLVNRVYAQERMDAFGEQDVSCQKTSIGFVDAVFETLAPLLKGLKLVIAGASIRSDVEELGKFIECHGISRLITVPSLANAFLNSSSGLSRLHGLRSWTLSGEALSAELLERLLRELPGCSFANVYGSSEVAADASWYRCEGFAGTQVPIGRPISNTQMYILDGSGRPVPLGVVGEIYVGGKGVARGYLNRPQLTAERFVRNPFSDEPDARMYKTGDLGHWRADGVIEYLGRNDHQVKVRGFRIELGEIESALQRCEGVREAVVLLREDTAGDQRLVAYLTSKTQEPTIAAIREQLSAALPEHMVPSAYVVLDALPLTPTGKIDRKALPAPELGAYSSREYVAPRGEMEAVLAQIWQDVLKVERVGRHDNFFELGGHSLLATQAVSRIRQRLQVEVPLRELFEHAVLERLAKRLSVAQASDLVRIERADRNRPLALSFAQQRLWFLDQLEGASSAYHIAGAIRLHGALDATVLRRSLDTIVARHEVLRTVFIAANGEPMQRIVPEARFALRVVDIEASQVQRHLAEEAQSPFDLAAGPLIRGVLIRLSADEHLLAVTMHHIISDAWSIGVLLRELSQLYRAYSQGQGDPLLPLSIQYADYAQWQRQFLQGEVLQEQLLYWQEQLKEAPALLELPTDRMRPARRSYRGGSVSMGFGAELSTALKALARQQEVTLYMVLYTGWVILLSRLSGQQDVVIGTPVANRQRSEVEELLGLFVNMIALRTEVRGDLSVKALLEQVREKTLQAYAHQETPLEQVVEAVQSPRSLSYSPIFQVMFVLQNTPPSELVLPGLKFTLEPSPTHGAQFDLSLFLQESGAEIAGVLEYASDLFDRQTMERWAEHYQTILEGMVANAQSPVSELSLLTMQEREQILRGLNPPEQEGTEDRLIHELFEERVARTPEAIALVYEEEQLTYAQLNNRANQLARHLRKRGLGPDQLVGLCMEPGLEMVVGLLGVLKAGAAYVPLDPNYPESRLQYLLEDAAPKVVLTQEKLKGGLVEVAAEVIVLDADWTEIGGESCGNLDRAVGSRLQQLAYVIYTSGSTGQPKGVAAEHGGFVDRVHAQEDMDAFSEQDVCCQKTNIGFVDAVFETLAPLLHGRKLVIAGASVRSDVEELGRFIERHGVTRLITVPSLASAFLSSGTGVSRLQGLRSWTLSGEALSAELLESLQRELPDCSFINVYGCSEVAADASWYRNEGIAGTRVPIGRPLSNTQIYILDGSGRPVPLGVVGEIYVGGTGVARGYLNRPELTVERFVRDPFSQRSAARMYKTGDLGRWRADGNIEYLGRNDHQVKIRGYRIELGEIEAQLSCHAEVKNAIVVAYEDRSDAKRLVAYVVAREAGLNIEHLRTHLSAVLPEYMVPSAYVVLDTLPLTPNGKIDRKALPAPELEAYLVREYEAPQGEVEVVLAEIWQDVLKVERVGRHDSFFELGGHSLLATQAVSRIRQRLQVEVPLRELFEHSILQRLANRLQVAQAAEMTRIERADGGQSLALSFAQQRLWFLDQLVGASSAYNIAGAVRLQGVLDVAALQSSLDAIIARHDVLRTVFIEVDGKPVQRMATEGSFSLRKVDLSESADRENEVRRRAAEEAQLPFDLAHGPLIRGVLIRLGAEEHVLAVTMHHIVSDGWSIGVLLRELSQLYGAYQQGEADPLPTLPIQYSDYAQWQRQRLSGEVLKKQLAFWRERLEGAPTRLDMPTDRPRPAVLAHHGGVVPVELGEVLSQRLKALSRRHEVTLFMTLAAALNVLLSRYSGQDDISVGYPVANRNRAEVEGLIGFFVNTLVLRTKIRGEERFEELLRRVKGAVLDADAHQDLPFEKLVEELNPQRNQGHTPLFQVMLALNAATADEPVALPGLTSSALSDAGWQGAAKFELTVSLRENRGRIFGALEYNAELFDRERIERLVKHWEVMLEGIVADAATKVKDLPLLTAPEREQVLRGFNATAAAYPCEKLIHELFEEQVVRSPDAIALVYEEQRLTYGELNGRANQLAHYLVQQGIGPDKLVAICLERSIEMVVGVLAILKAGGAYVPLDPSYPAERLEYMLQDAAPDVVLTQEGLRARFADLRRKNSISLESDRSRIEALSSANVAAAALTPQHLAYVIYTSGSMGQPKGVQISHRNVVNFLCSMRHQPGLRASDSLLSVTSLSFDIVGLELFLPLVVGARVVLASGVEVGDPLLLGDRLEKCGATVMQATPATWQMLLGSGWSARSPLKKLCGGEALSPKLMKQLASGGGDLWNLYGPTETTIWSSRWLASGCPTDYALIGSPLANTQIYILDASGQPVPLGVVGEIYIGGDGVARGYLNRPELTAERFVRDPFSSAPDARMYKTGDLGRWRADGNIEYLGRNDHQVKIRGFRIELGEIESVLQRSEGVREAVVLLREDTPGDQRLVAYLTAKEEELRIEKLRAHLGTILPEYMVPSAYVVLPSLPLTPNGKTDRNALPAPELTAYGVREYEAPQGETEVVLAEIWQDVLKVERVGRHDSFFELGGHSLLATQAVSRIRQRLQVEVALRELFENSVLVEFAKKVQAAQTCTLTPIVRVDRNGPLPLSYAQQRLWFLDQLEGAGVAYAIPVSLRLRGSLDRSALQAALDTVVSRHEILRTTFESADDGPVQVIAAQSSFALKCSDVSEWLQEEREAEVRRLAVEEARAPFNLSTGPLIRGQLVRLEEQEHVLSVTMHHIVSDGWSLGVLIKEVALLYAAYREGRPDPLPPLAIQYADYAVWQRSWLEESPQRSQLEYWQEQLASAPELLELPTDRPRPEIPGLRGDHLDITLADPFRAELKRFSNDNGTTPFVVLLTALKIFLLHWTNQADIVVGTVTSGRRRLEIEPLVGCFINFLPLRSHVPSGGSASKFLKTVSKVVLDAYANQDFPFDEMVNLTNTTRNLGQNPIFNVALLAQNYQDASDYSTSLLEKKIGMFSLSDARPEDLPGAALLDLRFVVEETPNGISVCCHYSTDLFERDTVLEILESYASIARKILISPEDPISSFEISQSLIDQTRSAQQREGSRGLCIASSFNAELLQDTLRFWMSILRTPTRIEFAPHGQVFQELLDPSGLLNRTGSGVRVVLFRFEDWLNRTDERVGRLAFEQSMQRLTQDLLSAIREAMEISSAKLMVIACPASNALISDPSFADIFDRTEANISKEVERIHGVHFVSSHTTATLYAVSRWDDEHADAIGGIPYTAEGFAALGSVIARKSYTLTAPPYKVIVLDCDNTLWRGVCGEEDPKDLIIDDGIMALHEYMVKAHDEGVLLCLCSKNEPHDVWNVFEQRPDFPLRRHHFADYRINWQSKAENLRSLSKALQLDLSSFIFIDDSPIECFEIRSVHPTVLTLQLPDSVTEIRRLLRHVWAFDRHYVSEEATRRTAHYQARKAREEVLGKHEGFDAFLASLNLVVEIEPLQESHLQRVSELIQRTNQFNLSGIRRHEAEVRRITRAGDLSCSVVHVRDRFGDYGLTGVVLYAMDDEALRIDTLLLSCRVLGRGVEHRLMNYLAEIASGSGCRSILAPYVRSSRNQPILKFLNAIASRDISAAQERHIFEIPIDIARAARVSSSVDIHHEVMPVATGPEGATDNEGSARVEVLTHIASSLNGVDRIMSRVDKGRKRGRSLFRPYVAPVTPTEEKLASIWQDILRVNQVGRDDVFFDVGGNSLLAVRVASRIRREFGLDVPLIEIFQSPTVRELASLITMSLLAQFQPGEIEDLQAEIDLLSEDEIRALLEQQGEEMGTAVVGGSIE